MQNKPLEKPAPSPAYGRSFGSDNHAGTHPDILEALIKANEDGPRDVSAYGSDPYTVEMEGLFKRAFGESAQAFPVFNGTAANVLSLSATARSFQAVICAEKAHIGVDECGSPEKIGGFKLLTIETSNGKITPAQVKEKITRRGDQHAVQPKVISISNTTEYGTLYSIDEIRAFSDLAKNEGLYLHVDGARISNAAAALNVSFQELITDTGVDVLSFGGTKNGCMGAEAVVFLNPELAESFFYIRKQNMQLASKMRFISIQLSTLLKNDLWKKNANHANEMAGKLEAGLREIPSVRLTQQRTANALFVRMDLEKISAIQSVFPFYVWDEKEREVRLMTSFQTTEEDVNAFLKLTKEILK